MWEALGLLPPQPPFSISAIALLVQVALSYGQSAYQPFPHRSCVLHNTGHSYSERFFLSLISSPPQQIRAFSVLRSLSIVSVQFFVSLHGASYYHVKPVEVTKDCLFIFMVTISMHITLLTYLTVHWECATIPSNLMCQKPLLLCVWLFLMIISTNLHLHGVLPSSHPSTPLALPCITYECLLHRRFWRVRDHHYFCCTRVYI